MTSPRIIRHLLLLTACAWGFSSTVAKAAIGEESLPVLIGELQRELPLMSPDEREQKLRSFVAIMNEASAVERGQQREWWKRQWAALSPDQRDQLRNQIREHWQNLNQEQRQQLREERRHVERSGFSQDAPEGDFRSPNEDRGRHLSPDQRQEFRQWMRERRGEGAGGHGGAP